MIGGATRTRHSRLSISEDERTASYTKFHAAGRCGDLAATGHWHRRNTLATMLRTSREMLICRAGQLGVSLDISDEVAETRAFSCSDKRLVDPLLERLQNVHGK